MPDMNTSDYLPAPSQRWTYRRPATAGWYWWQPAPSDEPFIVRLLHSTASGFWHWKGNGGRDFWTDAGRWLGPLTPPMAHEAWRTPDIDTDFTVYDNRSVPADWNQSMPCPCGRASEVWHPDGWCAQGLGIDKPVKQQG